MEEQTNEIPKWEDEKKKIKFEQFKARTKEAVNTAKDTVVGVFVWIKENPLAAGAIATAIYKGCKEINKMCDRQEEREHRLSVYDRRKGHYVKVKRELKPREWKEFDERYANGESATDILSSMGLIKY